MGELLKIADLGERQGSRKNHQTKRALHATIVLEPL
jgi:hypothetical protein